MRQFVKIVQFDFLQRIRSYAFLVTLAVSLYAAYSFVPPAAAAYATVRVGVYVGLQNAAWIGYATAMMTSIFLCWTGFYLVNNTIKKDMDTGVGMIIATTSISNFQYLMAKACSNFLVLLSITGVVFLMSMGVFLVRSTGYSFQLFSFILPYLVITVPALFFFSALAVTAEVFLHRYTILINILFFFVIGFLISLQLTINPAFDVFGVKPVTAAMEQMVRSRYHAASSQVSMGFNFSRKPHKYFDFEGIQWPGAEIAGRFFFIGAGMLLIFVSSKFFHRFDVKERLKAATAKIKPGNITPGNTLPADIRHSILPPVVTSYRIMPFIKTELLMLYRKGPRWLWLINAAGMIALIFTPLAMAHNIVLPCLWFLQVGRWSDLVTKEKTNRIHYFSYASYKPLTRLLPAQITAAIILALALASPLVARYFISLQITPALGIVMGAIFIVLAAAALGMLSGGKRLFEILFFLCTYMNVEQVPFADYFGGMNAGAGYITLIGIITVLFAGISFAVRKIEIGRM